MSSSKEVIVVWNIAIQVDTPVTGTFLTSLPNTVRNFPVLQKPLEKPPHPQNISATVNLGFAKPGGGVSILRCFAICERKSVTRALGLKLKLQSISPHEPGVEFIGEGEFESGFLETQIEKSGSGEEREDGVGAVRGGRSRLGGHESGTMTQSVPGSGGVRSSISGKYMR